MIGTALVGANRLASRLVDSPPIAEVPDFNGARRKSFCSGSFSRYTAIPAGQLDLEQASETGSTRISACLLGLRDLYFAASMRNRRRPAATTRPALFSSLSLFFSTGGQPAGESPRYPGGRTQ